MQSSFSKSSNCCSYQLLSVLRQLETSVNTGSLATRVLFVRVFEVRREPSVSIDLMSIRGNARLFLHRVAAEHPSARSEPVTLVSLHASQRVLVRISAQQQQLHHDNNMLL
jgi:hypothetical protein